MDQVPIDTRSFRRSLRALEREIELSLISQTECCGVSSAQCHLLLALDEAGETSVGELAEFFELDASTLSRTVDRLVKSGLLARREDPDNRRRQLVSLSAEGRGKAAEINALCDAYYGSLLSTMPREEAEALSRALPRLVEALRKERRSFAGSGCCVPGRERGAGRDEA